MTVSWFRDMSLGLLYKTTLFPGPCRCGSLRYMYLHEVLGKYRKAILDERRLHSALTKINRLSVSIFKWSCRLCISGIHFAGITKDGPTLYSEAIIEEVALVVIWLERYFPAYQDPIAMPSFWHFMIPADSSTVVPP